MAAKKRGRSKRRQEVQVPFPTLLVGVLVFLVVIGAGYMSINIRCAGLGKAIKTQESGLGWLRRREGEVSVGRRCRCRSRRCWWECWFSWW